eukprot:6194343-Lingulodinium_polyedra.AAC.1
MSGAGSALRSGCGGVAAGAGPQTSAGLADVSTVPLGGVPPRCPGCAAEAALAPAGGPSLASRDKPMA